ncbi:MAG: hypothetical protein COA96_05520 [SAR86 cluster bacterium]|uniref:Transcriptional regulator n=1 Tax=SAR86 cluster bacterium TaxID=2030880 RepID=A0A2A5B3T9_9GAMM|nr:MAG: hypothetical protein COA96_05520 [SAR86 cluster bacterium]
MQTLTKLLLQEGLTRPIVSDTQIARVVEGTTQRRYNLVNRASKAGELHSLPRGLYVLSKPYRDFDYHPFALAQLMLPGSYVSLETALSYHGWIPEAVYETASIVPTSKSVNFDDELAGRFNYHPTSIMKGHFLELVGRVTSEHQVMLVASPIRALMDLVCLRKLEWQGLEWFEANMRIEPECLALVTKQQINTLKTVYKQKHMQVYLCELKEALQLN